MSEDKSVGELLTAITGLGWTVTFENRDESRSVCVRCQKGDLTFQVMTGREDLERSRGDANRILTCVLQHAERVITNVKNGKATINGAPPAGSTIADITTVGDLRKALSENNTLFQSNKSMDSMMSLKKVLRFIHTEDGSPSDVMQRLISTVSMSTGVGQDAIAGRGIEWFAAELGKYKSAITGEN